MPTEQQISVMREIAQSGGAGLPKERLIDLIELIGENYIEGDPQSEELYRLTAQGRAALDKGGVGA